MRVLVTRPRPAAEATAKRLSALGHRPVLLPLARAVHDRAAAIAAFERPFDALIVTSAEVFRVLGNVPASAARRRIFCVGPATARAAAGAGFTNIAVAEGTGLSLAGLILAAYPSAPATPLLYLAGEPRSPDLEAGLAEAGFPVTVAVCYRMRDVPDAERKSAALLDEPPDAVLLYSGESAARFFRLSAVTADPGRFARTRFLCISEKTAKAVPTVFTANIAVAASPDENGLIALLPLPSSQN